MKNGKSSSKLYRDKHHWFKACEKQTLHNQDKDRQQHKK
jgi:hypothetical protein